MDIAVNSLTLYISKVSDYIKGISRISGIVCIKYCSFFISNENLS